MAADPRDAGSVPSDLTSHLLLPLNQPVPREHPATLSHSQKDAQDVPNEGEDRSGSKVRISLWALRESRFEEKAHSRGEHRGPLCREREGPAQEPELGREGPGPHLPSHERQAPGCGHGLPRCWLVPPCPQTRKAQGHPTCAASSLRRISLRLPPVSVLKAPETLSQPDAAHQSSARCAELYSSLFGENL